MKINKILSTTAITAAALFMGTANNADAACFAGGAPITTGTAGADNVACTGNTTVGFLAGAGNDTVLNGPGGTYNGTMFGEDGDDQLQNVATITGDMNGGAGNDSIQQSGTQTGNILGGTGDDSIAIRPGLGNITGVINAGDGNDALQVNGTIVGSAIMGAGNDTVVLAQGAAVTADVNTQSGDDVVFVNQGTISGNISLEGGTDQFFMNNGEVTGNIDFGDNSDISNETFALTGGTLNGNFNMGGGDDAATLDNAGVLGGTVTNIATAIFDGDKGTDLGEDTLTYITGQGAPGTVFLSNLINWETINLNSSGTVTLVGDDNAATNVINFDSVDNLAIVAGTINNGTVSMQAGNDTLLVDLDAGGSITSADGGANTGTGEGEIDLFGFTSANAQTVNLNTATTGFTNFEGLVYAGGGTFNNTGTFPTGFSDVFIQDNTQIIIPTGMDVTADIDGDSANNTVNLTGTITGDSDTVDAVIDLGQGDDVIIQNVGSSINGQVALGNGDDVIDFTNSTLNASAVYGGAGDDTLISGSTGVNQAFVNLGTGDNYINGTVDNDGTIVGPITITGDLENTDGVLYVEIDADVENAAGAQGAANSGVVKGITVQGSATLGGMIVPTDIGTDASRFEVGEYFDVVTAAGGISYDGGLQANETTLDTGSNLTEVIAQQRPNELRYVVVPNTEVCSTINNSPQPYQDACVGLLYGAPDEDAIAVLGAISNNPDYQPILNQLLPEGYFGMATAAARAKDTFMTMVDYRMGELRAMRPFPKRDRDNGIWLRGVYDDYNLENVGLDAAEVDTSATGVQLGYDYRLDYETIIGATVGYTMSDVENNVNFEGESNAIALGLYGTYRMSDFHIDAMLSYLMIDNETERSINIVSPNNGSVNSVAESSFDSTAYGARLGLGYDFQPFNGFEIGPFGELKYNVIEQDGTTETGAGILNLSVDDYERETLTGKIGARATYDFVSDDGEVTVVPSLRAAYVTELMDPETKLGASLAGQRLVTNANEAPDNAIELGVGVTAILNDTYGNGAHSVYGSYETLISMDDPEETGSTASLGYKFKW